MTDLWASGANVIVDAGSPTSKNLGFTDDAAMTAHIENFILPAVQGIIGDFLRQAYTSSTVPAAVKYTAIRVAAQALIKISIRKMGALISVQQWKMEVSDAGIFTDSLRKELEPYHLRAYHAKSTSYATDEIKNRWNEP